MKHGHLLPTSERATLTALIAAGLMLVLLTAIGPTVNFQFGGMAHWVTFALSGGLVIWAAFACDRLPVRTALPIILLVAVAIRLLQLAIIPYLSDDMYRYVWDGRVAAAGINPYRYIPAAPELAFLRDGSIYPHINRADYAPTIYPPSAQLFFLAVTRLGESIIIMKSALVACEAAAITITFLLLQRLDLPPTRIVAFAWHPLAVWEIAGSGHIDALMVALLMLALITYAKGKTLLAGAIATAAALVKPTALLALPVFWRRWSIALPAIVLVTAALLYLPYLSVGWKVFGFLSGYVAEEGLQQGHGFRLLMIAEKFIVGPIPHGAIVFAVFFAGTMLALSLFVAFRQDRSAQASVAALALLLTTFLILLTPHYPWYYLVLVPFVAIYPWSWTLWVLTIAGVETYNEIPGDTTLPNYDVRQAVFNALVFAALIRDAYFMRQQPRTYAKLSGVHAS